jgi:hypothetical protein
MESKYFVPIDAALPEAEQQARAKRQRHAEWGVAVAGLGGTNPPPELLAELQRYIDGAVSLAELCRPDQASPRVVKVYEAVAYREKVTA